MPSTLLKPKIQQAIVSAIRTGPFYRAVYDPTTDELQDVDESQPPVSSEDDAAPPAPTVIAPRSIKCNELSVTSGRDQNYGLGLRDDVQTWTFEANVSFHCEVIDERFRENVMLGPICVPADSSIPGFPTRLVNLSLVSATHRHPPTSNTSSKGGSVNGSKITYLFEASPRKR